MSNFFSDYGLEMLLGAAFIVFAMSASRFITGVIRSRKGNSLSAGSRSDIRSTPELKNKKK